MYIHLSEVPKVMSFFALKKLMSIISGLLLSILIATFLTYTFKDSFYYVDDWVVGYTTLIAYPKRADLFFAISIMALFPLLAYLSDCLFNRYLSSIFDGFEYKLKTSLTFLSLNKIRSTLRIFRNERIQLIVKYQTLLFLFGATALFGILSLLSRFFFIFLPSSLVLFLFILYTSVCLLGLLVIFRTQKQIKLLNLKKGYGFLIVVAQILILSNLAFLLPLPYRAEDGSFGYVIDLSHNVYLLFAMFALIGTGDLYFRVRKEFFKREFNLQNLISPIIVSIILIPLFNSSGIINYLPSDDYHFGEILLPHYLLKTHEIIPYDGYIPAHGLSNLIPSILADFVTDSDMLSVPEIQYGYVLYSSIIIIFSFVILVLLYDYWLGFYLLLSLYFFPFVIDTIPLYTLYLIFFSKKLLSNYFTWIITFSVVASIMVTHTIGLGSVMVLSLSPLAFFMLYSVLINKQSFTHRNSIVLGLLSIAGVLVLIYTPTLNLVFGIIDILRENSSINLEAYGTPLKRLLKHNSYIYSLFQNAWLFIIPSLAVLSLIYFRKMKEGGRDNRIIVFVLISSILYGVLIIPYSLGRIDLVVLSRTGEVSISYLFFIIPMLLKLAKDNKQITDNAYNKYLLFLTSGIIVSVILIGAFRLPKVLSYAKYQSSFQENNTHKYIRGADFGLASIGNVIVENKHLNRIISLNKILNKYLQDDDSYLDLTNRNAHYFYTDRKLLIESGAFYNMAHTNQQMRSINILKRDEPKLILIEADNILHDTLTLSLRAYPVYRWLSLSGYSTVEEEDLIFMLRDDIYQKYYDKNNDKGISILSAAVSTKNIEKIPISWGHSYKRLKSKMVNVRNIDIDKQLIVDSSAKKIDNEFGVGGTNLNFTFDISAEQLAGDQIGLMVIDITCDKSDIFHSKMYYSNGLVSEFESDASYEFFLKNGKNIIPVDLDPQWLLGGYLNRFKLEFLNNYCNEVKINNIELNQRTIVEEIDELYKL